MDYKLLYDVCNLLSIPCIPYHESLAMIDALNYFIEFWYVEKLANKLYARLEILVKI